MIEQKPLMFQIFCRHKHYFALFGYCYFLNSKPCSYIYVILIQTDIGYMMYSDSHKQWIHE